MNSNGADARPDIRRHLAVFVTQLVLTGLAVLLSRLQLGVRPGIVVVMVVAAVNGVIVATFLMGVRRDGRIVAALAIGTLVLITGLLAWPAWDVSQRVRLF